jgi:DNA-binding transcriptional ArsR family regulator
LNAPTFGPKPQSAWQKAFADGDDLGGCKLTTKLWSYDYKYVYNGFMDALFGSQVRNDVLIAIGRLGETYPAQLAAVLGLRPTEITRAVASLERCGAIASKRMGRTRIVRLEPRYWAKDELYALLLRLSELPRYRNRWATVRGRPRAIGKA